MTSSAPCDVGALVSVLNELAAFSLAESWDNVGLLAGDPAQQVRGILVALDPTEEVLDEAVANGCNVIITHHPLIFKPLKAVRLDQPIGRLLGRSLAAGVAMIACHTNLDLVGGGVNDVLAERFGLNETQPLSGGADGEMGFGRVGDLSEPLAGREMLARITQILEVEALTYAGALPETVEKLAVCGGSGSELAESAQRLGAQMYITGEVKHSTARWAEAAGFCVVDGGHFATENLVMPEFVALLQRTLADRNIGVDVTVAKRQSNPWNHFVVG